MCKLPREQVRVHAILRRVFAGFSNVQAIIAKCIHCRAIVERTRTVGGSTPRQETVKSLSTQAAKETRTTLRPIRNARITVETLEVRFRA